MKTIMHRPMKLGKPVVLCLALLWVGGCHSIGPRTISRDRFEYSGSLAESWNNQMLLNLVKTRYLDLPIYLEVGQIVSGYSLETSLNVNDQIAKASLFRRNEPSRQLRVL